MNKYLREIKELVSDSIEALLWFGCWLVGNLVVLLIIAGAIGIPLLFILCLVGLILKYYIAVIFILLAIAIFYWIYKIIKKV